MKVKRDIKTLDIVCGNYKKSGYCYNVGETLKGDIMIAFNAGKVLSDCRSHRRISFFQRLRALRLVNKNKDVSNEAYSPLSSGNDERDTSDCEKCIVTHKDLIDSRIEVRIQSSNLDRKNIDKAQIKELRKEEEKKQAEEEREQMIAEFEDILEVRILDKSNNYVSAEIVYNGNEKMDYDWFKRSARWFFQRQSLSNYEI